MRVKKKGGGVRISLSPTRSLPRGRWRQRWSQNPSQEPTSSPKPRRAPRPPAPRRPARYRARAVGAKTRGITQGRLRVLPPRLPPPPEVPRPPEKTPVKTAVPALCRPTCPQRPLSAEARGRQRGLGPGARATDFPIHPPCGREPGMAGDQRTGWEFRE